MPELPEVESLRRSLLPFLPTSKMTKIDIFHPSVIAPSTIDEFTRNLLGKNIETAHRKGKYLVLGLRPHGFLTIHLRMTGQFFHRSKADASLAPIAHTHVILHFENGSSFHYSDVRRFGKLRYDEESPNDRGYRSLGPEPLQPDFTIPYLMTLKRRNAPVKSVLLQQNLIAGLGNIYADESLFLSRIHPQRAFSSLTDYEIERLHRAIGSVLSDAIVAKGSSLSDYLDANRERGTYQTYWKVYQQTGKPCFCCGTTIEKMQIAGRSSHFCPLCQSMSPKEKPQIIGITGGISSGKSTVVHYLQELGAEIIDADAISRSLTIDSGKAVPMIIRAFGQEYETPTGILDRKKLGELIFSNASAKERLNQILHPLILEIIREGVQKHRKKPQDTPLILDIPLLFEAQLEALCDVIWLVYVNPETQLQRLMNRDHLTKEQSMLRISAQNSLDEKKLRSDFIIDNNGSIDTSHVQVMQKWNQYGYANRKE